MNICTRVILVTDNNLRMILNVKRAKGMYFITYCIVVYTLISRSIVLHNTLYSATDDIYIYL